MFLSAEEVSEHELDRRTSNGISWLLRGEAVGRAQSKECGEINQCLRIENTRRKFNPRDQLRERESDSLIIRTHLWRTEPELDTTSSLEYTCLLLASSSDTNSRATSRAHGIHA